MKETFELIDKWLQEAKDELSESIYASEEAFHRGEVAAYTKVGVLLQQRHLTSHSSRAADAGGYSPIVDTLDESNPPTGGSGVKPPPA